MFDRDSNIIGKLPKDGILAPIALYFIIFGIHAVIIYNLLSEFDLLSKNQRTIFLHSSWFVAGVPSIFYSLIKLKPLLYSTIGDKFLYYLIPMVFLLMMGVGIVNLI